MPLKSLPNKIYPPKLYFFASAAAFLSGQRAINICPIFSSRDIFSNIFSSFVFSGTFFSSACFFSSMLFVSSEIFELFTEFSLVFDLHAISTANAIIKTKLIKIFFFILFHIPYKYCLDLHILRTPLSLVLADEVILELIYGQIICFENYLEAFAFKIF